MGRVDIPFIDNEPEKKKELPPCAWCGSPSLTVCGRCKSRAYCSTECQRNDWKSGHQTACAHVNARPAEPEEEQFIFYDVPYVAHWAINVRRWGMQRESREFEFLLSKLPEEAQHFIRGRKQWRRVKIALARELAVRRMAEILTQGQWEKTDWKQDRRTGRDYLVGRSDYVWTGSKYINSNVRFPNFNFSICDSGEYLFVVSHPAALTGVWAAPALRHEPLPDPVEEFAAQLDEARRIEERSREAEAQREDAAAPVPIEEEVIIEDVTAAEEAAIPVDDEVAGGASVETMVGDMELLDICAPDQKEERQERLRQALVAKMAYFRTIGQKRNCRWTEVALEPSPVGPDCPGGESEFHPEASAAQGRRRHHLNFNGTRQTKWRCEVHKFRGYCLVVTRAPPEEAIDIDGEFTSTQAARFVDIDQYDKILDHAEPDFREVPIIQLLPESWHSDYNRACGLGEKGEQVRINR